MKRRFNPLDADRTRVREPYRVRLPGFLLAEGEEVGLGHAIEKMTYAAGLKPCGGCQQRASRLNRWVVFTR
jgi:hypothetical protein